MELLVASGVGVLTASRHLSGAARADLPAGAGPDLPVLRGQRLPVRDGPAGGGPAADHQQDAAGYTDPLPQALVLTAIVIGFGMTALLVVLALRGYLETGRDHVDGLAGTTEDGA